MRRALHNPAFWWHVADVIFATSGVLGHLWLAKRLRARTTANAA